MCARNYGHVVECRSVLPRWIFSSLPLVRKPKYLAGLPQLPQRLADSFFLARQDQLWPDIGQRLKDKLSQVHARVWQLQPLIFNVAIAAIEQVDVDRSRNIP